MKVKVISLPYIFQVLYFTRPRHQVGVYRTIDHDSSGLNTTLRYHIFTDSSYPYFPANLRTETTRHPIPDYSTGK